MIENNFYVHCLMVEFNKAIDTIDRVILIHKLQTLNMPPIVYNWITYCTLLWKVTCIPNREITS